MEGAGGGFRRDLVSELLRAHFTDGKTKVGGDALWLMAELLKIFVVGKLGPPEDGPRHCPLVFSWGGSPLPSDPSSQPGEGLARVPAPPTCPPHHPPTWWQKRLSAAPGRPRQKTSLSWTWTSWRRCCLSCSWTSRGRHPHCSLLS
ncbi:centromere protein X isoform X1 [Mustela lutreola]|uniref:centromere protein X isoform X1 n=1 Tax=Mustela lutreola TaxID=9666 RepID=UPI002796FB2F|nr:centromere protein X isoform X1 [Mustela lutreola]